MERFYRLADITFRITGKDEEMYQEDGVLTSFRVAELAADHSIHYEIVEHLPEPEGECVFLGKTDSGIPEWGLPGQLLGGHLPIARGRPYSDLSPG